MCSRHNKHRCKFLVPEMQVPFLLCTIPFLLPVYLPNHICCCCDFPDMFAISFCCWICWNWIVSSSNFFFVVPDFLPDLQVSIWDLMQGFLMLTFMRVLSVYWRDLSASRIIQIIRSFIILKVPSKQVFETTPAVSVLQCSSCSQPVHHFTRVGVNVHKY